MSSQKPEAERGVGAGGNALAHHFRGSWNSPRRPLDNGTAAKRQSRLSHLPAPDSSQLRRTVTSQARTFPVYLCFSSLIWVQPWDREVKGRKAVEQGWKWGWEVRGSPSSHRPEQESAGRGFGSLDGSSWDWVFFTELKLNLKIKSYTFGLVEYVWASLVSHRKESACQAGGAGSISGSGRSPGEGNRNPLQ